MYLPFLSTLSSQMKQVSQISFMPLQADHFPLLLKWLEMPHIKAWWDHNLHWTPELIKEKYGSYIDGYKVEKGVKKPLQAYIIYATGTPIGYIQLYNAYDFPRENGNLPEDLPKSLAALDFYIGEPAFIGKGLAPLILHKFFEDHVRDKYKVCFVDPNHSNRQAIRTYEKVGFQPLHHSSQGNDVWMLKRVGEGFP